MAIQDDRTQEDETTQWIRIGHTVLGFDMSKRMLTDRWEETATQARMDGRSRHQR
jgi:hypothetical protein